ncbi:MAG: hypothetical protein IBX68_04995 [Dehalococcoidia bacterium]|nr:hypothetical protein [Dehalococcoidia bacterium]
MLSALEWLASDIRKLSGIDIELKVLGTERRIAPEAELVLFRIAQEALRNVWRHSQAAKAVITVVFQQDSVRLTIADNGKGFDLQQRRGDLTREGRLGLAGMEERARLLGGNLTIQSAPGEGATITVEAPI